jgi:hypothetical protein
MSFEDCSVIAKCLEGAGAMIYEERGYIGGGDNVDIMSQVEMAVSPFVPHSICSFLYVFPSFWIVFYRAEACGIV